MSIVFALLLIAMFAIALILMYFFEAKLVEVHNQVASALNAPFAYHVDYRYFSQYGIFVFSVGVLLSVLGWLAHRTRQ
ncbi:MAG: hypothetical protein ACK4SY_07030 [Pyrobaculum sp.]